MSNNKPLFLVSGVTGSQGGSVARALLRCGKFRIRGICRDVDCNEARELMSKGVEIIRCDFSKCDDVCKAMQGVEIFFCMTDYWDEHERTREYEIGRQMVDCAKKSGIKHFIWSWLPNVEAISKGKYNAPMFTNKARVAEYAMQQHLPLTCVGPAFFYQNFKTMFPCEKDKEGVMIFTMPQTKMLTAFDVEDMGDAVCTIACNRSEWMGKTIPLCGDNMPPQKFIDQMCEATGQKIRLNMIPRENFAKLSIRNANEIAQMFGWFDEFGYFGPDMMKNLDMGKKLNPNMKTWRQYLQTSKWTPK